MIYLILFAKGFIKTGLGRRIAYQLIRLFGSSSFKLGYTLVLRDFIISPATPSNTARSGGIMFPIVRSLASVFGSEPGATARKIGAFLMVVSFQADAPIAAAFLTSCAPNPLMAQLAADTANVTLSWSFWATACIVPVILSMIIIPLFLYHFYPPEIRQTPQAQAMASKKLQEMGPMSRDEKIISCIFIGALLLWSTSQYTHVNATIAALLGVTVMLMTNVLNWNDVLTEKGAWDGMMWMGGIVGLASALNKIGFIPWFAESVTAALSGVSWTVTLAILFLVYLYSHYAFASLSGHDGHVCGLPRCGCRRRSAGLPRGHRPCRSVEPHGRPHALLDRRRAHLFRRGLRLAERLVAPRLPLLRHQLRHLDRHRRSLVEIPGHLVKKEPACNVCIADRLSLTVRQKVQRWTFWFRPGGPASCRVRP